MPRVGWEYSRAKTGCILEPGLGVCRPGLCLGWKYSRAKTGCILEPGLGVCRVRAVPRVGWEYSSAKTGCILEPKLGFCRPGLCLGCVGVF